MGTQKEEIIVRAGFDNSALAAGVRQSQNIVKEGFTEIKNYMVGALGAAAVFQGFKKVIDFADDLKDRADNLGVSTDFLQGLGHIAGKDAVGGIMTFNKAITDLSQKLGDAKNGSEDTIKKFQKWGITLKEIEDLDAEGMFYRIADALRDIPDPAKRTAAAFELLGKSGKNMTGILSQGSEEIKNASAGVVKISQANIDALAQAKDKLEDIGLMSKILGSRLITDSTYWIKKNWELSYAPAYDFFKKISGMATAENERQNRLDAQEYERVKKLTAFKLSAAAAVAALNGRLEAEDTSGGVSTDDYERRAQLQRKAGQVGKYSLPAIKAMLAELQPIQDRIDLKNAPDEATRLQILRRQTERDMLKTGAPEFLGDRLKGLDAQIADFNKANLERVAAHAAKQTTALEKLAAGMEGNKMIVRIPSD